MKVPNEVHRARGWRVGELASDFTLLDVSLIPIDADPARGESFEEFFAVFVNNGGKTNSGVANALFALRLWLGKVLKLDDAKAALAIPGCSETSLVARLTEADRAANRAGPSEPGTAPVPITRVYVFEDDALMEISNATIHALIHLGWVDGTQGRKQVEMAVYVKSRGRMSDAYMALIKPFRHTLVYPPMISQLVKQWRARVPRANLRRALRSTEIPEPLRRIWILDAAGAKHEAIIINLSTVGARVDLPGASGLLKKGSEISIRSQTSELQFSAMVVYVETKTATSLGLYFHKPYEQNMLAKLLAPVSSSTAP